MTEITTKPRQFRRRPSPVRRWRQQQIGACPSDLLDLLLDAGITRAEVLAAASRAARGIAAMPDAETKRRRPVLAAQHSRALLVLQHWHAERRWAATERQQPPGHA